MSKVISIVGQSNSESLMFILELAKIIEVLGHDVAVVGDGAYQSLLFDYDFDLVEISNVNLKSSLSAARESVVIHNGYVADAAHYIVLVKHDLLCVKSLSRQLMKNEIAQAIFVLIDELDVAWRLNYVYTSYFSRFVECPIRVSFPIDECAKERMFRAQVKGEIALAKMSTARLRAFQQLLKSLLVEDVDDVKKLKKLIKRG